MCRSVIGLIVLTAASFQPGASSSYGARVADGFAFELGGEAITRILIPPQFFVDDFTVGGPDDLWVRILNGPLYSTGGFTTATVPELFVDHFVTTFTVGFGQVVATDPLGNPTSSAASATYLFDVDPDPFIGPITIIPVTSLIGSSNNTISALLFTNFFAEIPFASSIFSDSFIDLVPASGVISLPGGDESFPFLPTGGDPNGGFSFDDVRGDGNWFDPIAAQGFLYETDGNSLFTQVGMPSTVPDNDGFYTVVDSVNGSLQVPVGGTYFFPTPVDTFRVLGIDPSVDGEDPQAFPTFPDFNQSTVSFMMTSIAVPEPASVVLAGLSVLVVAGCRRRG